MAYKTLKRAIALIACLLCNLIVLPAYSQVNEVIINEGSTINLGSTVVDANIVAASDGVGSVIFDANYTLAGNIGSATKRLASATLNNDVSIDLADSEVHVVNFRLDEDSVLDVSQTTSIFGDIIGVNDNYGTVNILESLTSNGNFGGNSTSLKNINISKSANFNLDGNSVKANNITLANSSIVRSSSAATVNLSDSGFDKAITLGDEAKLRNTSSSGTVISYVGSNAEDLTITLNGVGNGNKTKIEGTNGAKAIIIDNNNADVTINNNSASIIGDIVIQNAKTVTINNRAQFFNVTGIDGNISVADNSQLNISIGRYSTINGDIDLGTNPLSSVSNRSSLITDLTFGNENQTLDIYGPSGIFLGRINGKGNVNFYSSSAHLWLRSSTLSATVNSNNPNNSNDIRILNRQNVVLQSNIGLEGKVDEIYISSDAIFDTATYSSSISANNIYLENNSRLNLGSGTISTTISNTDGTSGAIIEVKENHNLTSNINIGAGEIIISEGKSLDLNDSQITAANITLNENSVLNFEQGDVNADILSNGVGFGVVNFSENVEFLGNIGTTENPVANIIIVAGKTVTLGEDNIFNSNLITIGDGASVDARLDQLVSQIVFQGNSSLTISDTLISRALEGSEGSVVNFKTRDNQETTTAANIGAQTPLDSFEIGQNSTFNLDVNNNSLSADEIRLNSNSVINVGTGALNGDIVALTNNSGTINFKENNALNGDVGSSDAVLAAVNISENKVLNLQNFDLNATATNLTQGSVLNVGSGSLNSAINATSNNVGTINFNENNSLNANIGSSDAVLAAVNISENKALNLQNFDLNATATNLSQGSVLNVGSGSLNSTINTTSNNSGTINFNENNSLNANIGSSDAVLAAVNIAENKSLNLQDSNLNATATNLSQGSVLNVGSGSLNSAVNATSNNSGTINFNENNSLNANIGSSDSALAAVNILANKTLDLQNFDLNAAATNFTQGSVLNVGSGSLNSAISVASNNVGTINFNENNSISKNIGASDKILAEVNFAANKTFNINNSELYSNQLALAANAVVNANNSSKISGNISLAQDATFNVKDSATISGAINGGGVVNISTSSSHNIGYEVGNLNKLQEFNIAASSVANAVSQINANNVNVYGRLNLVNQTGNSISDNLNVKSGSTLYLSDKSHDVGGNLNVESNATISLDITSASQFGQLDVIGEATIDQNSKLYLTINQDFAANINSSGVKYEIIKSSDATNISAISDSNIKLLTNIADKNFKLSTSIANNSLYLNISENVNVAVSGFTNQVVGNTNGQRNLFQEIIRSDSSSSSGVATQLRQALQLSQSESQMRSILEDLNPQIDNSLNKISYESSAEPLNIASKRINRLRGVSSGDSYAKSAIWAQAFGSRINQDDTAISQGYKADSQGLVIGFDKEYSQDLIAGLAFSNSSSRIYSNENDKKTNISTYQLNFYVGKDFDNYFANAMFGASYSKYSSSREVTFANLVANANYSGFTYIGKFDFGANYLLEREFILTPVFSITMAKNHIENYQETGAQTYNLNVRNNVTSLFETRFGADLSKIYKISRMRKIQPSFGISYGYDFAGSRQKAKLSFVGQNTGFTAASSNIPQGSLRLTAGLKLYHLDSYSLEATFSVDRRNGYQAHSGSLRAKYDF